MVHDFASGGVEILWIYPFLIPANRHPIQVLIWTQPFLFVGSPQVEHGRITTLIFVLWYLNQAAQ